jgi:putative endonuclease
VAWTVYALVSEASGNTYVGVTTDLGRRLAQHNGERPGGARATRGGRPWVLGASWGPYPERGRAQAVEHAVKRLRGRERLAWNEPNS